MSSATKGDKIDLKKVSTWEFIKTFFLWNLQPFDFEQHRHICFLLKNVHPSTHNIKFNIILVDSRMIKICHQLEPERDWEIGSI